MRIGLSGERFRMRYFRPAESDLQRYAGASPMLLVLDGYMLSIDGMALVIDAE